jgi:small subunit ribosomal protein S10e
MVLIPKKNKRTVYEYLLSEGVIVIKKDFAQKEHKDTKVPNLHAWLLLRSLLSRNYVELVFNWHHYYYYVKTEGVKFLRDQLGIFEEVLPITFKKVKKNYFGTEEREEGEDRKRGERRGGRGGFGGRGRGGRGGRGRGFRGERAEGEEVAETQVAETQGGEQQE